MTWQIDPAHSSISFSVRHLGVAKTRGTFDKFTADVNFDEAKPANTSVKVSIDAASINTNQADRDGHLQSPDFFNVAEHPTITFESTKVVQEDGHNGRLIGNLTLLGVTKEVELNITHGMAKNPFNQANTALFTGQTAFKRSDFGMKFNAPLETGGVLIGDVVSVDISLELVPTQ